MGASRAQPLAVGPAPRAGGVAGAGRFAETESRSASGFFPVGVFLSYLAKETLAPPRLVPKVSRGPGKGYVSSMKTPNPGPLQASPVLPLEPEQGGVAWPPSATRRTPGGHLSVRPTCSAATPAPPIATGDAVATKCTGFSVAVAGNDRPRPFAAQCPPAEPVSGGCWREDLALGRLPWENAERVTACAPGPRLLLMNTQVGRLGCWTWSAAEGHGPGGPPDSVSEFPWCPRSCPLGCPPALSDWRRPV